MNTALRPAADAAGMQQRGANSSSAGIASSSGAGGGSSSTAGRSSSSSRSRGMVPAHTGVTGGSLQGSRAGGEGAAKVHGAAEADVQLGLERVKLAETAEGAPGRGAGAGHLPSQQR